MRRLALGLLALGCAAPQPSARPELPPTKPSAVASPPPAPIQSEADAAPAVPPGCVPAELRSEGKIIAASIDDREDLSFCLRKGIGPQAPTRCLLLLFAGKTFQGVSELWPSFSFAPSPAPADSSAQAMMAENAGKLSVCATQDRCVTLRIRAPNTGAFDELYSPLPAVAVPGTSLVLLARVQETWPKNGPSRAALWVDAVDVNRRAKVASALVVRERWPEELILAGKKVLLLSCERETESCGATLLDPKSLGTKRLDLELAREDRRDADGSSLVQRTDTGELVLIDKSGGQALWLGSDGVPIRRQALGDETDDEPGLARVGRRNANELVVLRPGPYGGSVVLVNLVDGAVTRFEAPVCAE